MCLHSIGLIRCSSISLDAILTAYASVPTKCSVARLVTIPCHQSAFFRMKRQLLEVLVCFVPQEPEADSVVKMLHRIDF
jgi:hypothetical protein